MYFPCIYFLDWICWLGDLKCETLADECSVLVVIPALFIAG